jgi:hypothetical protein
LYSTVLHFIIILLQGTLSGDDLNFWHTFIIRFFNVKNELHLWLVFLVGYKGTLNQLAKPTVDKVNRNKYFVFFFVNWEEFLYSCLQLFIYINNDLFCLMTKSLYYVVTKIICAISSQKQIFSTRVDALQCTVLYVYSICSRCTADLLVIEQSLVYLRTIPVFFGYL